MTHTHGILSLTPLPPARAQDCWEAAGRPTGISVASVGGGTTAALQASGDARLHVAFTPSKADARTLAAELPAAPERRRVVYPASALAGRTLEDGLASRGFAVQRANTYTTSPVGSLTEDQREAAAAARVVSFGSPSAIRAWVGLTGRRDVLAACIGETSRDAALRNGFPPAAIFHPPRPGLQGWARAVCDAVQATQEKAAS